MDKMDQEKRMIPESVMLIAIGILFLCVIYLFYSNLQYKKRIGAELEQLAEQVEIIENNSKLVEASLSGQISGLKDKIDGD